MRDEYKHTQEEVDPTHRPPPYIARPPQPNGRIVLSCARKDRGMSRSNAETLSEGTCVQQRSKLVPLSLNFHLPLDSRE